MLKFLPAIVFSSIFLLFNEEMTVKISKLKNVSLTELKFFPKDMENNSCCDKNFYTVHGEAVNVSLSTLYSF